MKLYIKKFCLGFTVIFTMFLGKAFAQTVDLNSYVTSTAPLGSVLEWHTDSVPSSANKVVSPTNVLATTTATSYWAFFYDNSNNCYSPGAKVTVISNNCPTTKVNLTSLSTSIAPNGSVLEWHTAKNPTAANKVASPNAVGDGIYYAAYYDSTNNCYSPVSTPVIVKTKLCYCYKLPSTSGTAITTTHGITALGRAGATNGNWPMVRQSAWTVLEAKTKGFVVNRVAFDTNNLPIGIPVANFVEGMLVYDTTNHCLKLFANGFWGCLTTQTCPD